MQSQSKNELNSIKIQSKTLLSSNYLKGNEDSYSTPVAENHFRKIWKR